MQIHAKDIISIKQFTDETMSKITGVINNAVKMNKMEAFEERVRIVVQYPSIAAFRLMSEVCDLIHSDFDREYKGTTTSIHEFKFAPYIETMALENGQIIISVYFGSYANLYQTEIKKEYRNIIEFLVKNKIGARYNFRDWALDKEQDKVLFLIDYLKEKEFKFAHGEGGGYFVSL